MPAGFPQARIRRTGVLDRRLDLRVPWLADVPEARRQVGGADEDASTPSTAAMASNSSSASRVSIWTIRQSSSAARRA